MKRILSSLSVLLFYCFVGLAQCTMPATKAAKTTEVYSIGSLCNNKVHSQGRAQSVKAFLMENGIWMVTMGTLAVY